MEYFRICHPADTAVDLWNAVNGIVRMESETIERR